MFTKTTNRRCNFDGRRVGTRGRVGRRLGGEERKGFQNFPIERLKARLARG